MTQGTDQPKAEPLTAEQEAWIAEASRTDVNGWLYVRVGGEPFQRGFQHGYLVAKEWADAVRVYSYFTLQTIGMDYSFFVESAAKMHTHLVPEEMMEEVKGLAAGLTAAGVPATADDVIGWNAWMELTDYWWPTVATKYAKSAPKGPRDGHCSAFVATGSATADGKIVIGHTSFDDFWSGQHFNVLLDLTPAKGHRMVMQSVPGYLGSFTDFWITDAGLAITETTIGGFQGYDETRVPVYVRSRQACQYADTIDQWVEIMNKDSNGGYANCWLLADINTNEIARYEEGLIYQAFDRKTDGWYWGDNAPLDPRIRNLECGDVGVWDTRWPTGARSVRWPQLLGDIYAGKIDAVAGQKMLADGFDPYLGYWNPSMRSICSHYDADPLHYLSTHSAPFKPFGSVDGKVATADSIAAMSMWGRVGRADGHPFDADEHLREHPQWAWQAGYLASRPSQPWTYFDNGKTETEPGSVSSPAE